ncbi:hypothetical protein VPH35_077272 [Triticum aestivum]|uniref:Uncharacterized protein n=1 Tax=Aegilops tauschii subsp. strangulata TaxID=200361 RepID=A0A453HME0_AEGTS
MQVMVTSFHSTSGCYLPISKCNVLPISTVGLKLSLNMSLIWGSRLLVVSMFKSWRRPRLLAHDGHGLVIIYSVRFNFLSAFCFSNMEKDWNTSMHIVLINDIKFIQSKQLIVSKTRVSLHNISPLILFVV